MIDLKALALALGHNDFSVKNDTEFSVDGGGTWTDINVLTVAQRSTYDTELAALAARRTTNTRISELKKMLLDTDYVTLSDYDKDKAAVLVDRQAWREEIRTLEASK